VDALEPQSVFGAYFKDIHSYITILDMGTMEESNKAWTFLLTAYYNTLGIKHRQSSIGENSYGTLNSPVLPLLGQFINCSQKSIILDIGSGHGFLLFYFAIFYGCLCIGVETNEEVYKTSTRIRQLLIQLTPLKTSNLLQNNVILLNADISDVKDILGVVSTIITLNNAFTPVSNLKIQNTIATSSFNGTVCSTLELLIQGWEKHEITFNTPPFSWSHKFAPFYFYFPMKCEKRRPYILNSPQHKKQKRRNSL